MGVKRVRMHGQFVLFLSCEEHVKLRMRCHFNLPEIFCSRQSEVFNTLDLGNLIVKNLETLLVHGLLTTMSKY